MRAATYGATLDLDDPHSAGFETAADEAGFEAMGRALALELAEELRGVATVRYWRDPR